MESVRKALESNVRLVEELFKTINELKGLSAVEKVRRTLRTEIGEYNLVCMSG